MVGVYLAVWVKQALLKHIRGVQTVTVGTGMMGYLGNKGAISLSNLLNLPQSQDMIALMHAVHSTSIGPAPVS